MKKQQLLLFLCFCVLSLCVLPSQGRVFPPGVLIKQTTVAAAKEASFQASIRNAINQSVRNSVRNGRYNLRLVPSMTPSRASGSNLHTPTGQIPPYRIIHDKIYTPLDGVRPDAQVTAQLQERLDKDDSLFQPSQLVRDYFDAIPEDIVLRRGQITVEQQRYLKSLYHYLLEVRSSEQAEDFAFASLYAWSVSMSLVSAAGFLAYEEDADFILEMAANVPKKYRVLTDYITVRALLNLKAYEHLEALAFLRNAEEHWYAHGNYQREGTSLSIFEEVEAYGRKMGVKFNWPLPLKQGQALIPDGELQYSLTMESGLNCELLNNPGVKGLIHFLQLKDQIPPLR